MCRDADIVLAWAHEEHFSPLPAYLKATIDIGSIVTTSAAPDGSRMRDGHFFSAFETLHAFLIVERFFTLSTREFGLSLTEFRIMFEIDRQGGMALPGSLSDALLLAPSSITYALNELAGKGLTRRILSRVDRRRNAVALTEAGSALFAQALERTEAALTTDIRPSTRRERDAYKDAAMIMVSSLRKAKRKLRAR